MFDGLRGFAKGWKMAGKYPGMSADAVLPYAQKVLDFLEDGRLRLTIRNLVCDKYTDPFPFEFSYDVLPFSLASCVAYHKGAGNEAYHRLVDDFLATTGKRYCEAMKRKPCYPARILADPDERSEMAKRFIQFGIVRTTDDFWELELPWATWLGGVFPMRSVFFSAALSVALERQRGQSMNQQMIAFGRIAAQGFLKNSTGFPTEEMESRIAFEIVRLFMHLTEIPEYRGR